MNRLKNLVVVTLALAVVALAISQYHTARVVAGAEENVYVVNAREMPVPVVQVTKWEYKVESCTGSSLSCANLTLAGLQGFELVAVSRGPEKGTLFTWELVFKRPKL